ncbi:DUF4439 domain-containing protein [Arthrobacter sp. H35-D1]|uniref:DUF4439 domain-containing protein n=1 Tax=Arthrobacter sp. H35-D1 TaxID=3046202 RepID=UPI0024B88099|nr:DUF4439 domain-containing protein [Arthrobacter sp. H35-D1]MDJ0313689.1 DUF4439 domain-containing protein [Arthrobacter sp. H35-D1]
MSNPPSQPGHDAAMPETAPGSPTARSPRKVPRRATAPAGAPAQGAQAAAPLLIIGSDGMTVKAPAPLPLMHDAGNPHGDNGSLPGAAGDDDSAVPAEEPEAGKSAAAEKLSAPAEPAAAVEGLAAIPSEADAVTADAVKADAEVETVAPHETAAPAAADALVSTPNETSAPATRREKRLAELQSSSGSAQAPAGTSSTSSTSNASGAEAVGTPAANKSAAAQNLAAAPLHPEEDRTAPVVSAVRPKRSRPVAFLRGLFFLAVISALVVGMGTVLSGQEDATVGPSQTELDRQSAWEKTTLLQAQATALGSSTAAAQLQQQLQRTANDLAVQASALGDGLPPNTAELAATATAPTSIAAPTVMGLLQGLDANAEALLEGALTAEHAMGGVFAAAGTSQFLQARQLAAAVEAAPPASQFLPVLVDFPSPVGPECSSTLEPRPGATIDAALRAAAVAEQKAVYAYQVSTTRMAEPQFSQSAELLARHEEKLAVLDQELEIRCLPPASPVAGFGLDPSFTANPETALAALESELAGIYADLAALSPARSGDAAAHPGVPSRPVRSSPAGPTTAAPTAAATDEATTAGPVAASGTLRELSVLWLLDSALTQEFWGGTVGALAGMADQLPR